MKATAILAAVLACPLAAIAQPVAETDKAMAAAAPNAQARPATTVSDVVVQACRMPADSEAYSTRSSRPTANAQFDAPPHPGTRTEESPGTRDFILRNIADFRNGTADFDHMDDELARITRSNLPLEKRWILCRGAFKNLKFLHVSRSGFDDFEVDFEEAAIEWEVAPLDSHQKVKQWASRFYYPEPATRQFDDLLKSMERGRPNYDRLAPDFAPTFEAQWPSLQQTFKRWRGAHSIVFLHQEGDGSYAYKVAYRDHVVFWTVAPPDAAGRITGLTYEEGA